MAKLFVLLVLAALAAYSQASVTYGSQRTRQVPVTYGQNNRRRDPSYRPVNRDPYDSRRDGRFGGRDSSYPAGSRRSSSSYDNRRNTNYGRQDNFGHQDNYPGHQDNHNPKYDAGQMVRDVVYNPSRRPGMRSSPGSLRRVASRFQDNRGCNCLPGEFCDTDRDGHVSCRRDRQQLRPFPRKGCEYNTQVKKDCSGRGTMTVWVNTIHGCQRFFTRGNGPYCGPRARINGLFGTRGQCEAYCQH